MANDGIMNSSVEAGGEIGQSSNVAASGEMAGEGTRSSSMDTGGEMGQSSNVAAVEERAAEQERSSSMEKGGDIGQSSSIADAEVAELPPPLYEKHADNSVTGSPTETLVVDDAKATEDGRFDITLNPMVMRRMTQLHPTLEDDVTGLPPPAYSISTESWTLPLNIVVQVVGSRGDVQPFIALGNELQTHGHRVRIATHPVFEKFVKDSGLEFFSIGGDPNDLMAYMVKNPGLVPGMQTLTGGDIQKKRLMISEMLDGLWSSCIEPDAVTGEPFVAEAIIANPPSFAHIHCAQALGIPCHLMFTMPWSSTRAFPHPLANLQAKEKEDKAANFLSYGVVDYIIWRGVGDIINDWRSKLGMEEVADSVGPFMPDILKIPFTYCWSPALIPKPSDWPAQIDVCGFFFRQAPNYTPDPAFLEWLNAGSRPIYIGFGSIVLDDAKKMTDLIIEAVKASGVRAIVSRGWSKIGGPENTESIYYIDDCPHEWLFQQVSTVIHHGGAGTTACGLFYGCATTIVPFFGDQPFWGSMVAAAGAGPKPIPHKQLTSKKLTAAIQFCLLPEAAAAAGEMSAKMKEESGVKVAVDSFHRNLPVDKLRCDIMPELPAAWIVNDSKSEVRLSKCAAELLIERGILKRDSLQPYDSSKFDTKNRRWDPLTGTISAASGSLAAMVTDSVSIFSGPMDEYRKEQKAAAERGDKHIKNKGKLVANMAGASALSGGKFLTHFTKGTAVDIPLAFVEGLHQTPRLYGDSVREHREITDWKSGFAVAGKQFAYGFTGFSDILYKPYQEAKKGGKKGHAKGGGIYTVAGGAIGAAKGVGMGFLNMGVKFAGGTLGIVAYSSAGIAKSLHTTTTTYTTTRRLVGDAKRAEGLKAVEKRGLSRENSASVTESFVRVRSEREKEMEMALMRLREMEARQKEKGKMKLLL